MPRWAVRLAVAASLGAVVPWLAACGPTPPPQITAVSPAPSQGGTHTNIVFKVTFSVPMNRRSVETRLRIHSRKGKPPPGCDVHLAAEGRATGCYFRWRDGGRVMELLHPQHPLAVVTTYRVDVLGGIESAAGAVNQLAHSWGFSTEGGPSLSSTFPGSGSTIGPDQSPAVNFDRAMNLKSLAQAVTLSPSPPGGYSIAANLRYPGRYLLEPARPLAPGSTYTLTVTRAALDVDGNHLQGGAKINFKVSALGSQPTVEFPAGPVAGQYSEVLASPLPQQVGDPPSLRILATAPAGQHYSLAVGSPDGGYLATELAGNHPLTVQDLGTGKSTSILGSTGAALAAWSPNSQLIAFIAQGALRVYTLATKQTVTLSAAATFTGPISWRSDGEVLAAVATSSGMPSRVALLSPGLRAVTYLSPSPTTTSNATEAVWGPQTEQVAFAVGAPPDPAVWLYQPSNGGTPFLQIARQAGTPLAFLNPSTILLREPSGALASLLVTGGGESTVVGPRLGHYPEAVAVSVRGRQLSFTRESGGYLQLYLANDTGSTVVPLTAFSAAQPLSAGPPVFVGE